MRQNVCTPVCYVHYLVCMKAKNILILSLAVCGLLPMLRAQVTVPAAAGTENTESPVLRVRMPIFVDGVRIRSLPGMVDYTPRQPIYPVIGHRRTRQEINRSPGRDVLYLSGFGHAMPVRDGALHPFAAGNPPLVFIDGVKIRGNGTLPLAAVESVETVLAGTPANLGDSVSGFLLIATRQ